MKKKVIEGKSYFLEFVTNGHNAYIAAMDLIPYKEGMQLVVFQEEVANTYATFNTEEGAKEFMHRLAELMEDE